MASKDTNAAGCNLMFAAELDLKTIKILKLIKVMNITQALSLFTICTDSFLSRAIANL